MHITELKDPTDKKVLSIDIGLDNLALVFYDDSIKMVTYADVFDIRNMTLYCTDESCTLHHTKTFTDYVEHLLKKNQTLFDSSDIIIIEQQPPGWTQIIEQLIFSKYRDKCDHPLISPNSMQEYHEIGHLEYEDRKIMTEKIAHKYLCHLDTYIDETRRHDMADAMCNLLYYLFKKKVEKLKLNVDAQIHENNKIYLMTDSICSEDDDFIKKINKYKYTE